MIKIAIRFLFLLFLVIIGTSSYSFSQKYKVYTSFTNFKEDKYIEASYIDGKQNFRLKKTVVVNADEVWGYKEKDSVRNYEIVSLYRRAKFQKWYTDVYTIICGELCLYYNGHIVYNNKGEIFFGESDGVPLSVSKGMEGKIYLFTDLNDSISTDATLVKQVNHLKKVQVAGVWINERIPLIESYNVRHRSEFEFNNKKDRWPW